MEIRTKKKPIKNEKPREEDVRRKAAMEIVGVILNASNVRLSALGLMHAADLTHQTGRSIAEWAQHFDVSRASIYKASKEWDCLFGFSEGRRARFGK